MLVVGLPALALINPRFTPTDLVRSAQQVLLVKVSPAKDKVVTAEVAETIRGTAPTDPKLNLHVDPAGELAVDDVNAVLPATGLLVLAAPESLDLTKDPLGALLVGKQWFAVF
jgi:hypothetical protein